MSKNKQIEFGEPVKSGTIQTAHGRGNTGPSEKYQALVATVNKLPLGADLPVRTPEGTTVAAFTKTVRFTLNRFCERKGSRLSIKRTTNGNLLIAWKPVGKK